MANFICNIIDETIYSNTFPNCTLVEINLDKEIDAFKYEAVKIEDEYFQCNNDPTKAPKSVQIDVRDSRQKTFIGKCAEFIKRGKLGKIKAYELTTVVYY